jgi:hypothetical protein
VKLSQNNIPNSVNYIIKYCKINNYNIIVSPRPFFFIGSKLRETTPRFYKTCRFTTCSTSWRNTVKKDCDFPSLAGMSLTKLSVIGQREFGWLGTGKSLTFFYDEVAHLLPDLGPVRFGEVPLLLVVVTPLLLLLLDGSLSQPFL